MLIVRRFYMKLTNDSYTILIGAQNFTERYYRDTDGWIKVSARGRKFRMTAEQVLNHVLPAIAGIKPNLTIKVEHHDQQASFVVQSRTRTRLPCPGRFSRKLRTALRGG